MNVYRTLGRSDDIAKPVFRSTFRFGRLSGLPVAACRRVS